MARTDSTKIKWRVQVRGGRGLKWKNYSGLFETRSAARYVAAYIRHWNDVPGADGIAYYEPGYGFGNTRVVKHIRGEKK